MNGRSAEGAASPTPGPLGAGSDALHDLLLLIRSRYGLVHLRTVEEERAGLLLRHLADRLDTPLFAWSRPDGLRRADLDDPVYDTADAGRALDHLRSADRAAVYHFRGFGTELDRDPTLAARLREDARILEGADGAVVLTGQDVELPPVLRRRAAVVDLPGPGPDEFRRLLSGIVRDVNRRRHVDVELTGDETTALVNHLSGLTLMEAEKILTKAIVEDGRLAAGDIRHVIEAKRRIVEQEGLLEYYPADTGLGEIADLRALKQWLGKRKAVWRHPNGPRNSDFPSPVACSCSVCPGAEKACRRRPWPGNGTSRC